MEEILTPEELHLLNLHQIKVGSEQQHNLGESSSHLDMGIMQGDYISAVLFIFYLAHVLMIERNTNTEDAGTLLVKPKYSMQMIT